MSDEHTDAAASIINVVQPWMVAAAFALGAVLVVVAAVVMAKMEDRNDAADE